jgi:hypothetical protein
MYHFVVGTIVIQDMESSKKTISRDPFLLKTNLRKAMTHGLILVAHS